ncbi:RNA polymerase sigma factor [Mucilaginibacter arboris]|uniref:Sigma-70 family RNA polymerase sigma factor n=1 Tax=Mucilaginibacter arboris TaxID=2682090 RepID=A0A7K1STF9_9SPHI|nr:sigma-70 family RNA polymerase sigma factor [Mucilaginibacter arboris]
MLLEHRLTELIEGCRLGNRKAQETLYKLFAAKMLGVCLRYATDKMEAEDMLQNGFIKVFGKLKDFKGEGSFEGWVRRIMVHSSIEYYRKHHKMMQLVEMDAPGAEQSVNAVAASSLEAKDLLAMIQTLPAGYRMVFNLYAMEGFSHKEIGAMLQISEGASKSQLSRARTILKEMVNKMEGVRYEDFG